MYVSLWAGNIDSDAALADYTALDYSDDSAPLRSPFTDEFRIDSDDIDEDFIENIFRESPSEDLAVLLADCSYADAVIAAFSALNGGKLPEQYQACILIYDYLYEPKTPLPQSAFAWLGSMKITYQA